MSDTRNPRDDQERWSRIEEILDQVIDLSSAERTAHLERACAGDVELRQSVESLLKAEANAGSFLRRETRPDDETLPTQTGAQLDQGIAIGDRIGNYRLLQKLGEGGMGQVFEAQQEYPVRRRVALKIIKWGMDTRQVIARFEAERQALAMMDHPNIARVVDGGATEQGRPFFVMELVSGVPITEHCDTQRLTTRERLELFREVCEGVQHAHQNTIIHRDLKPSNVLVSYRNGKATPKIIDFGVAKATAQRLTEKTVFTEIGVLIGTPEYMSPEQAEMTGQNVDTRTDVYSLGAMLYELLVGALPFESKELRRAGYDEIRRKIREEEPSKPSTRLSTLEVERVMNSAKRRRTDLSDLRRQLSGDLDWITMKALAKDRGRRYVSPAELAADIERHLVSQPVLASPPSAAYRAGKFVRRNRLGVGVAAGTMLTLVAFAASMTIQAGRIARERDRANSEAEAAEQTSEFLENLFEMSGPDQARGSTVTARELLDRSARRMRSGEIDREDVRARLLGTMGNVYLKLGLFESAEPLLTDSRQLRRSLLGDDHPDTLTSTNGLANLYIHLGRYDEAETLHLETLDERKRVLGDDHPDTLTSMSNLAGLKLQQGRYDEVEPVLLETLAIRRRVLGDDHSDTLVSMNSLAGLYIHQGRHEEAEPLLLETLEDRKRVFGDDHPDTLVSMLNLASLYLSQGRNAEAELLYRETLVIQKRVLGDDHPDTLSSMNSLANAYRNQGRYDEAEPLYLATLEKRKRMFGDDHPKTLNCAHRLARMYGMQGRHAEAEPLYLKVVEARRRVLGDDHPNTVYSMIGLGGVYRDQGRHAEAEALFLDTLDVRKRVLGDDHPFTLWSRNNLASLYGRLGRFDEAESLHLETLESRKRMLGDDHPDTALSFYDLACIEALRGDRAKAMSLLRQSVNAGYANADWMPKDSDLETLHGPEFDAIVERARQNAAAKTETTNGPS